MNRRYPRPKDFSKQDKTIKIDRNKGAAENVREILTKITKKHGTSETRQCIYLNEFIKVIDVGGGGQAPGDNKDLGFTVEDILLCLRVVLVNDSSYVRAAAWRAVKYLVRTPQDFSSCIKLQYPCLLARSLDLLLDNDAERIQALRVTRRLLLLNPSEFPMGLTRCLVAIAMTPIDIRDRLLRSVIGTLVELCVLNPEVFILCGGVKSLTRSLSYVGPSARMGEVILGALLFLVNKPETRNKASVCFDCLAAPLTDPHTITRTSDGNISKETHLQWANSILVSLLRSWPGLMIFGHPDKECLRSIVNTLYLKQMDIRNAVLNLLSDLFCLNWPEWTDEISVALEAVDPSRYQESFKLSEGFIAAEGKTVLPHISKTRVNIVEVHLALLLYSFLEAGLLDAIVEVIVSDDTFLSVRASILLGELLHKIHILLPPEICHLTPALPNLMSYAARGRPTSLPDCPGMMSPTQDIQNSETKFNTFKWDSNSSDNIDKKKTSVSNTNVGRVRTISGQSLRSRTVSDSSAERGRTDNETQLVTVLDDDGDENPKTTTLLQDSKDALSDMFPKVIDSTMGEGEERHLNVDPQFLTVPENFSIIPKNSKVNPGFDVRYDFNREKVEPSFSSLAQQRALTAVSTLSKLQRLLRKRPAPSSLFLDHFLTSIDRKRAPNCFDLARTKGKVASNKNKLTQQLIKECEEAIKDSGVLTIKDPFIWNWDSILAVLKGRALYLCDGSNQRSFLRRLIKFLLPKNHQLMRVDALFDRRAANMYTIAVFELIDCLLSSPSDSEGEKLLLELWTEVSNEIDVLLTSESAHTCFFSPHNVMNTSIGDYFFYIGHMTRTEAGLKILDKVKLLEKLHNLVKITNHECYIKLIVSVFDYTKNNLTREIFNTALSSKQLPSRLYCTKLAHVLLRTPLCNHHGLADWVVEKLVDQLYDEEKVVVNTAVQALDEACDQKEYLEALVRLRPSLLHLGDSGQLLLCRFLSTKDGFDYLHEANFVTAQLSRWASHFNYRYVCLVESQLCDAFTHHRKGEDGRYCTRLSGVKNTPGDLFLPPHLYGQLTQHEPGFQILIADEHVQKLVKTVVLGHCNTDEEILQLKSALWALGHIGGSCEGAKWARNNRVTLAMIQTARYCQVYSVRATAFYSLNITATNLEGANSLKTAGWYTVKHHRHEKWPVLATSDLLEDINTFMEFNDSFFERESSANDDSEDGDKIKKSRKHNNVDKLKKKKKKSLFALINNDELFSNIGTSRIGGTPSGKSATLPHYIGGSGGTFKYFHFRSASESKADSPSNDGSSRSPCFDGDLSYRTATTSDLERKSITNGSMTTCSSSSNSNVSAIISCSNNDQSQLKSNLLTSPPPANSSLLSDKIQTLSPIPSDGSLATITSTAITSKTSRTSKRPAKQSMGRLSQQDVKGYATLKLLTKNSRPLQTPFQPAVYPLSPIDLLAFQDFKQMSPLIRPPRHGMQNKVLMSEFEARDIKMSHLWFGEDSPQQPIEDRSLLADKNLTHTSLTEDESTKLGFSSPIYMGICLPQQLAELFPNDDDLPSQPLPPSGAPNSKLATYKEKESFRSTSDHFFNDAGYDNISSGAESETDTGTDTCGGNNTNNINRLESSIKRRHNRNSCLLCSVTKTNSQRVSRWRKVSASSTHRIRTETESSYGGTGTAVGEGESPLVILWQTRGGLEGINSIDSSSTDATSIAQRSVMSETVKSRSVARKDLLKYVEQLANPVLYKSCKQALLHMKQMYSDVFQDTCVYSDVYNIISSTPYRIQSRRFLQELFLDIPFSEMYEDSNALLGGGGDSDDEFVEDTMKNASNAAASTATVRTNGHCSNITQSGSSMPANNIDKDKNMDNNLSSMNANGRIKSPNGKTSINSITPSVLNINNSNPSSMLLQLEVIPENDARSDSSEPFSRTTSRDNSIVYETSGIHFENRTKPLVPYDYVQIGSYDNSLTKCAAISDSLSDVPTMPEISSEKSQYVDVVVPSTSGLLDIASKKCLGNYDFSEKIEIEEDILNRTSISEFECLSREIKSCNDFKDINEAFANISIKDESTIAKPKFSRGENKISYSSTEKKESIKQFSKNVVDLQKSLKTSARHSVLASSLPVYVGHGQPSSSDLQISLPENEMSDFDLPGGSQKQISKDNIKSVSNKKIGKGSKLLLQAQNIQTKSPTKNSDTKPSTSSNVEEKLKKPDLKSSLTVKATSGKKQSISQPRSASNTQLGEETTIGKGVQPLEMATKRQRKNATTKQPNRETLEIENKRNSPKT